MAERQYIPPVQYALMRFINEDCRDLIPKLSGLSLESQLALLATEADVAVDGAYSVERTEQLMDLILRRLQDKRRRVILIN